MLPPRTTPLIGSCGPTVRRSKPRMRVLATLEDLLENRQVFRPLRQGSDGLQLPPHTERHPCVLSQVPNRLDVRLVEVRVAAEAGQIHAHRQAAARRREDGLIEAVLDNAGRDTADDTLAVGAHEQRVGQERVALEQLRIGVDVGNVGHPNPLVAVPMNPLVKPLPMGNPNPTVPPVERCVNWPMYPTSLLKTLALPVMFRSNRNGSVNPSE